jgi:hypothetical protein
VKDGESWKSVYFLNSKHRNFKERNMLQKYIEIGYQSALMKACWTKDIEQVRKLLAENPDSLWQVKENSWQTMGRSFFTLSLL